MINKGYTAVVVLDIVGLSQSNYYININRDSEKNHGSNNPEGRPTPGYSYNLEGKKVSDEQIEEWPWNLVTGDGFPYGYRKLTVCLKEDYRLLINKKRCTGFVKNLTF